MRWWRDKRKPGALATGNGRRYGLELLNACTKALACRPSITLYWLEPRPDRVARRHTPPHPLTVASHASHAGSAAANQTSDSVGGEGPSLPDYGPGHA